MAYSCPRILISGIGGDTGKTLVSVGLSRAWKKRGKTVVTFKKGPDYIDMGWLALATGRPCYNLDLFFMERKQILYSFILNTQKADIAVIEGNRGFYDGLDVDGKVSTAELSKLLHVPSILIIDCTKVTRTVAALVLGCQRLDPQAPIKGVILNQLAHSRHEGTISACISQYCNLPVVGAIPKLPNVTFPGRHLGLVPPQEHPMAEEAINTAAEIIEKYIDLDKLLQLANEAEAINVSKLPQLMKKTAFVKIGVIRDSAFQFYYPENLEALRRAGTELIEFSALKEKRLPPMDALYIGGGFPETHAQYLAKNVSLRESIKEAAERGLPIYAECGGLMYLGKKLIWQDKEYPMVGLLPISIGVRKRPQGHGYTIMEVDRPNPYFPLGQILKGHEFHYSYVSEWTDSSAYLAFKVRRGYGIDSERDGLCYKNVLATYTHLHALGTKDWVSALIGQAKKYKMGRTKL